MKIIKKSLSTNIKKIVSKCASVPLNEINEETSMQNTFKWDSLAHVKIMIEIEKKYTKIKTSEFSQLNSVKKIIAKISKK